MQRIAAASSSTKRLAHLMELLQSIGAQVQAEAVSHRSDCLHVAAHRIIAARPRRSGPQTRHRTTP